ncbi:hypothetical protein [Agriterribacter sp.]|uniref:hypothetical protein n=1 Tax=Agriterribacter sp. TaxID=2821509 RepID=UPI002C62E433|nr:hypothetical protein [Agriterribacter sp.]HRO47901.1 hypothetical protein [Agriterribacter sp.]HRQ15930.1 hypothetical protein [Agriterribacter sp.]
MYNEDQKIVFHFSSELDIAFLQELYSDDLQQAEMVFESSVQQLRNEQQLAASRFHDGDIPGLKKVIHKMKPLLGYIGMNKLMEEFAAFEQTCIRSATAAEAEEGFHHIKAITLEAIKKAEREIKRLKQHNTQ